MKVGIPKGLLYHKYHPFLETFFNELGAEIIVSPDTNKEILDDGIKYCVSEACLPVKIFHGHAAYLKDKCDVLVIPRIMRLKKREYICPKFCGLPEMIKNSIEDIPEITIEPIYADNQRNFYKWIRNTGRMITKDTSKIDRACSMAIESQKSYNSGINNEEYDIKVALIGHPYNVHDNFVNMNLVKKFNKLGVGVITEEYIDENSIANEVKNLYKRPFWTFAKNSYGTAVYLSKNRKIDGVVYISSFGCGIDSVITELIQNSINEFPFLIIKVDEHTGQAGYDTRIEAFIDMLERRS